MVEAAEIRHADGSAHQQLVQLCGADFQTDRAFFEGAVRCAVTTPFGGRCLFRPDRAHSNQHDGDLGTATVLRPRLKAAKLARGNSTNGLVVRSQNRFTRCMAS